MSKKLLGACTVRGPGCLREFTITKGYTESETVCYVCLRRKGRRG